MSSCPLPADVGARVLLAHGGGGSRTAELLRDHVAPALGEAPLRHDAAVLPGGLALTTDGFVVRPLRFPGGDLGRLAVLGTCNDLAMAGARPIALTLALVLEEGLPLAELDAVLASVRSAADEVGVPVVTGDTKVVERGRGDGIYVVTTGLGRVPDGVDVGPWRIRPGDAVLLTGDVGRHGVAVLSAREGLGFEAPPPSDLAALGPAVEALLAAGIDVHALRDCTRGGLAAAVWELAGAAGVTVTVEEEAIPVDPRVAAASALLGIEPAHLACEGRCVVFVAEADAAVALDALRRTDVAAGAIRIGHVDAGPGEAWIRGRYGDERRFEPLSGELLPRIC